MSFFPKETLIRWRPACLAAIFSCGVAIPSADALPATPGTQLVAPGFSNDLPLRPAPNSVQLQCTLLAPLTISVSDQARGSYESLGIIQIQVNSQAGCVLQVSSSGAAFPGTTGHGTTNLEIKAESHADGGQILGGFSDFSPLSPGLRNLWACNRAVSSDFNHPALDLSIRIPSVGHLAAGDYATTLTFTAIPN